MRKKIPSLPIGPRDYSKQNRSVLDMAEKDMDESQLRTFRAILLALASMYVPPKRWAEIVENAVQCTAKYAPSSPQPIIETDTI